MISRIIDRVNTKLISKIDFSKINSQEVATKLRQMQKVYSEPLAPKKDQLADRVAKFIVKNLYTSKYAQNLTKSKKPTIKERIFARLFKNVDKEQLINSIRKAQQASGTTPTAKTVLNDIVSGLK